MGDEILYGTMYGDLLDSCEDVTIECDKRLKNIFRNSFPKYKNSFVEYGKISLNNNLFNKYDAAIYAGSLGKFFRNKIEKFSNGRYLNVENNLIEKSKKQLSNLSGKINIGISWKSFKNRYSNEKSIILENFNNIFKTKNCNFINLQYGDVAEEIKNYNKKFNNKIITLEDLDLLMTLIN